MKTTPFFATLLLAFVVLGTSCKKDKTAAEESGDTVVTTLALEYAPTSAVYGFEYTFKLQFEKRGGDIKEYGIVYKGWVSTKTEKTPIVGGTDCYTIVFGTSSPTAAGVVQSKKKTIGFLEFNDANYRAYAILNDGTVVYGEIRFFVSA